MSINTPSMRIKSRNGTAPAISWGLFVSRTEDAIMKRFSIIVVPAIVGGVCGALIGWVTSSLVNHPHWIVALWMLGTADGGIAGMAFSPPIFVDDRARTVRDEFSNPFEAAIRFGAPGAFLGGCGGWIPGLLSLLVNAMIGVLLSKCLKRYPPRSDQPSSSN